LVKIIIENKLFFESVIKLYYNNDVQNNSDRKMNILGKNMNSLLNLPLISLVVTNYNYEKYLDDCLKGILNQTYRPIECIIIDDCSEDDSIKVIEEFIENNQDSDIKFRLIKNNENQGQLAGFVKGIKESRGVFIGFVDADDIILPEYVNAHVQTHFKTNVAMTVTQQIEFDENNQIHSLFSLASPQLHPQGEGNFRILKYDELASIVNAQNFSENEIKYKVISVDTHRFGGWYWGPTSNVIFRKKAIELFTFINDYEHWKYCADNILYNYAHLIGGSCLIYTPLTAYRRHMNNGFSNKAITGNIRFFTQSSADKIKLDRDALLKDTLELFSSAKEKYLEIMDFCSYKNLVRKILQVCKKDEILRNAILFKQLLDDQEVNNALAAFDNN